MDAGQRKADRAASTRRASAIPLVESGKAAIVTDFRQDGDGLTRILMLDRGLSRAAHRRALPAADRHRDLPHAGACSACRWRSLLSAACAASRTGWRQITDEMKATDSRNSQVLLAELTELAAELEADAAASLYRFGASRAYDGIVQERLDALDEEVVPGYDTWTGFLQRRVAPAMRTCRSVEERQANLSRKLTRATTLLRTWVDVEVEKQNRDLLASMNNRARLQLRLQQTVEGLSVAAVSYYVVGLIGYLAKGVSVFGVSVEPELVTAASVPFAIVVVCVAGPEGAARAGLHVRKPRTAERYARHLDAVSGLPIVADDSAESICSLPVTGKAFYQSTHEGAMSGLAMPKPDAATLTRRDEIVADMRVIVPGEGVVDAVNEMRAFESDGLTAYRQLPLVVVLPETVAQVSRILEILQRA